MRALLNAPSPDNIVFGMNMTTLTFHLSRIISRDWQAGDEIIVTALDHYANVSSWQQAAADSGHGTSDTAGERRLRIGCRESV